MIILGAKGDAQEVLDILFEQNSSEEYVFFDNTINDNSNLFNKFAIVNHFKYVPNDHRKFVLGVGVIKVRKLLTQLALDFGVEWVGVRAKNITIESFNVNIHSTVDIMQHVSISSSVVVSKGTLINRNVNIHHDVSIGSFCEIAPNVVILGGVTIGNNVFIGAGAIIFPNNNIENNVIIGAGTIVNRNIKMNSKVVGNPCRNI